MFRNLHQKVWAVQADRWHCPGLFEIRLKLYYVMCPYAFTCQHGWCGDWFKRLSEWVYVRNCVKELCLCKTLSAVMHYSCIGLCVAALLNVTIHKEKNVLGWQREREGEKARKRVLLDVLVFNQVSRVACAIAEHLSAVYGRGIDPRLSTAFKTLLTNPTSFFFYRNDQKMLKNWFYFIYSADKSASHFIPAHKRIHIFPKKCIFQIFEHIY